MTGKHEAPDGAAVAKTVKQKIAEAKKLIASVAGLASGALALELIPAPVDGYVAAALVVLGQVGLYVLPGPGGTQTPSGATNVAPSPSQHPSVGV